MPTKPPEKMTSTIIREVMEKRGLSAHDLARLMDGDEHRNRVMLELYLNKGGTLGPVLCHRIGQPLGLSGDRLWDIEQGWERYWQEIEEAGKQLNVESQRVRS